jgi:hypothetical protein
MKRKPLIHCSIGFMLLVAVLLAVAGLSKTPPPSVAVRFLQATNTPDEGCFVSFEMENTSKTPVQSAVCWFERDPPLREPSVQPVALLPGEIQKVKIRLPRKVMLPCRATFDFHVPETSFDLVRERFDRLFEKMGVRVPGLNSDDDGKNFQVPVDVSE